MIPPTTNARAVLIMRMITRRRCFSSHAARTAHRTITSTATTTIPNNNNYHIQSATSFSSSSSSHDLSSWTISFSGAGHLLAYHLGVVQCLLDATQQHHHNPQEEEQQQNYGNTTTTNTTTQRRWTSSIPPIVVVSGSSSGAIAATIMSFLPHRIDEFTTEFLQNRGLALSTMKRMLLEEEENATTMTKMADDNQGQQSSSSNRLLLVVGTTYCLDGSLRLFPFGTTTTTTTTKTYAKNKNNNNNNKLKTKDYDTHPQRLIRTLEASCKIPSSFHPLDMFHGIPLMGGSMSSSLTYPDQDGIEIDGEYFVDGGIAAPVPPIYIPPFLNNNNNMNMNMNTNDDNGTTEALKQIAAQQQLQQQRIIVSPFSTSMEEDDTATAATDDNDNTTMANRMMIRPLDTTLAIPGGDWMTRCGTFHIRPSIQNLQALVISAGVAPIGVLEEWHQRGINDTNRFLESYSSSSLR